MFCPLTTTGAGVTVAQTAGETRFVVDCKVNPEPAAGHVNTTLVPDRIMVSRGGDNATLKSVPKPNVPPVFVVPYKVLPANISPAKGFAPSLFEESSGSVSVKA